jgi:hypothetical protein
LKPAEHAAHTPDPAALLLLLLLLLLIQLALWQLLLLLQLHCSLQHCQHQLPQPCAASTAE